MVSAGTLIWLSLRPLLRLFICVGCGFAITKAGLLPKIATRGAGQIILNIATPCLLFSKIVPAFTSQNINALGPLILIGFIYLGLGVFMAWIISQIFWVPHRFRYGILMAGGWVNYGDIPVAVIIGITASAPFSGVSDQNLAVAYISALMLFYMVTFFPLGGHRLVAMDFAGPDVDNDEIKRKIRLRRELILYRWPASITAKFRTRQTDLESASLHADDEKGIPEIRTEEVAASSSVDAEAIPVQPYYNPSSDTLGIESTLREPKSSATSIIDPPQSIETQSTILPLSKESPLETDVTPLSTRTRLLSQLKTFLVHLLMPPTLSIILSFPIALVPKLKALFIQVDGVYMPNAPDGQPPLAFIMDAATFIGAATVPLGLICLGSALANMKIPRNQWSMLPIGAIVSLSVAKILFTPVLGVLITNGLVSCGLISQDDRVLRFICIFFSCLPTATTQVYLTQIYSGNGTAEHIPTFLLPQYCLMFLAMTALNAYTLSTLF